MAEDGRLRDEAVRERLARLDEVLEQVEEIPGPAGELALAAITELAQVYGEALARATGYAAEVPTLLETLVGDELLGHLLVLHDIHPEPVHRRVARVIDELRTAVTDGGGEIALAGIEHGVATVTLSTGGCGSAASGVRDAVRQAVLAVAPELTDVTMVVPAGEHDTAFIPIESLGLRTGAGAAGR
ncbi:NifU family protein [Saccharomonospora sp. NPDC046836]|uniref:NifU family protein n=1 Tax=Saccharomonospora sp. NPDC046836 TaxID=3156921 RepID=UPI003404DBC3